MYCAHTHTHARIYHAIRQIHTVFNWLWITTKNIYIESFVCHFYRIIIIKLFPRLFFSLCRVNERASVCVWGRILLIKMRIDTKIWWVILQIRSENPIESNPIKSIRTLTNTFHSRLKIISGNCSNVANGFNVIHCYLLHRCHSKRGCSMTAPTKCVNVTVILWHTRTRHFPCSFASSSIPSTSPYPLLLSLSLRSCFFGYCYCTFP